VHFTDNVKYLLKQLIIYPIKSCAGYLVQEWPLSDSGLFWDRQWMIVNNRGACLTQKQEPKLALIKPIINPTTLQLTLTCHNQPPLIIQSLGRTSNYYCKSKICGERYNYKRGIITIHNAVNYIYVVLNIYSKLTVWITHKRYHLQEMHSVQLSMF
jgi:hypothetical protein